MFSMIGAALSLGLIATVANLTAGPAGVVHAAAGLCLGWGLVAAVLGRRTPGGPGAAAELDLLSVLGIIQLALGLAVGIFMLYVASIEVLVRVPSLPFFSYAAPWQVNIWAWGWLDLALVGLAGAIAWTKRDQGRLMTAVFWLAVLACLWSALRLPSTRADTIQPEYADWVSPFALGCGWTLVLFVALEGWLERRRRRTAWPDQLENLVAPAPTWPGFGTSVGLVGVLCMVLGCVFITSPLVPFAAMLAGGSMLAMAHRRWNENLADSGLGLITLSIASLLMIHLPQPAQAADYFAGVFNRALLGLAIMTAFWHWLAGVWVQQLDQGKAWTTAGRLIRPCRRVGFIVAATGVLVAMHLALWPRFSWVDTADNTSGRWVLGLTAYALLVATVSGAARRTRKPTLAWLAVLALLAMVAFVVVRLPGTGTYRAVILAWPPMTVVLSGLFLMAGWRALSSAAWKPFAEPLVVLGVLVLPLAALMGVALMVPMTTRSWVAPATFGLLSLLYLTAGLTTGPRRFLWLAVVCSAAAVWSLLN